MKKKISLLLRVVFLLHSLCSLQVFAKIPEGLVSYFKAIRNLFPGRVVPLYYSQGTEKNKRTSILGDSCDDLVPFSKQFIEWTLTLSKAPFSFESNCECEDSVCYIELTDFFPDYFRNKIFKNMTCTGPNCFNATLIARGFLGRDQFRYSTEGELLFYLSNYCRKVPIDQRKTNDIVTFSNAKGIFAMHSGIYIDRNILFTKEGPPKTSFYSLEDWNEKFSMSGDVLQVFRCDFSPSISRNSELKLVEAAYSGIVDCSLSEPEMSVTLSRLELDVSRIVLPFLSSEADTHSLRSLKESITISKDKSVILELKDGDRLLVSLTSLKSVKKSLDGSTSSPVNSAESLQAGDYVEIQDPVSTGSHFFQRNEFYKILDIL